jgi:hypothetical protein
MDTCKDCDNANNRLEGSFTEKGCSHQDRLIWCRKKEAWVNSIWGGEKCFQAKKLICKSCGGHSYLIIDQNAGNYQMRCYKEFDCGVRGPIRKTETGAKKAWQDMNKEE